MRSCAKVRRTRVVVLCLVLIAVWHGIAAAAQEAPPAPEASAPPDLPPDVTLAQLVARKKHTCTFVGDKDVVHSDGPMYTAPLSEVMPKMLELQPNSLDAAAAAPNAPPCLKSLCAFVKKASCPNDLAEAMIRANCKEKIYKNRDIIDAAAKKCNPARVAKWREQYPDHE